MSKKMILVLCAFILSAIAVGCSKGTDANANAANTNPTTANANAPATTTDNPTLSQNNPTGPDPTQTMTPQPMPARPAADSSEVQTIMDSSGDVVETRTFKNNKNVTKVVVTTHGTTRTAKVYNSKGEARPLPENKVKDALTETGDALASAAGYAVDKTKDAAAAAKQGAETVGDKTADGARVVANKSVEGARTVGEGAKKGAKKVKNAIIP